MKTSTAAEIQAINIAGWDNEQTSTALLIPCEYCAVEGKHTMYPRTAKACPECCRTNTSLVTGSNKDKVG